MQVTRNENHTPTAFHANIVAMEQGNLSIADVADDYVHCTQCGACELRCPNTLFTGDFYRQPDPDREAGQGDARAGGAVRHRAAELEALGRGDGRREERAGDSTCRSRRRTSRTGPTGLDLPTGGETILFVDCEAAFYRTSVVALDRAACCSWPASSSG